MKPLADHPIDQIKLDHERCSFRKGSQDIENDLPPPQLLDQDDDDIDTSYCYPWVFSISSCSQLQDDKDIMT